MPVTGREKAELNEQYQENPELAPGSGSGLILDGQGDIALNPDGVTVEVSGSNELRVKPLGVGAGELSTNAVTTAKIDDDAVDKAKLAADVAGNGLDQAAGGELAVNVDGVTIEISADVLRIKDGGISDAKLATDKWAFKSGNPASSAAAAEAKTIYAGTTGGKSYIYVCAAAEWGKSGENWLRLEMLAF